MRTVALPETTEPWWLTSLREKLIKIGAKVVSHGRYSLSSCLRLAVSRQMFADIQSLDRSAPGTTRASMRRAGQICDRRERRRRRALMQANLRVYRLAAAGDCF